MSGTEPQDNMVNHNIDKAPEHDAYKISPSASDEESQLSKREGTLEEDHDVDVHCMSCCGRFNSHFADIYADKTMHWMQGATVMLAENISLGILSLPAVLARLGLAGGVVAIVMLGLVSTYSGYVLWQYKMKYPHINNYGDLGEQLLGRFGKEFFGAAYVIYCIFCMASHLLTFTIAMNVLTKHVTCTIVWGVVGLFVFAALSVPRTLKGLSVLSLISFLSIFSAVMLTIIALAVGPEAAAAVMTTKQSNFPEAFNSASNIVFAYGGHVAWISFIDELREPKDFPKALVAQQSMDLVLYTIAAVTIYHYAGVDVKSPALSSNSPTIKLIAWGIALPTIVIAGVIFAHVTAKYAFRRVFVGTKYLHSAGLVATSVWCGICFGMWFIAWVIAESIPNFSDLLGFISALFASWFSYGVPGVCWFVINWQAGFRGKGVKKWWLAFLNVGLILLGFLICGAGLYASGWSMANNAAKNEGKSWSCADNSLGN